MKKFLLLVIIAAGFAVTGNAQTTTVRREFTTRQVLDEKTVVKDSTGAVLKYDDWRNLMGSGMYSLKKEVPADINSPFVIYKLTEQQRAEMLQRMPPPRESGFFTNGEKIASFRAYDMDGKRVELKDLIGKVVVLNFWFINCPPCRQEIPELNKLVANYANNPDVVFVAVGLDQRSDIKTFVKQNPYNYRLVADGRQYANVYGVNLYPTNVVIDKTGTIKFNASGLAMNTPNWIKKAIDESLAPAPAGTGK